MTMAMVKTLRKEGVMVVTVATGVGEDDPTIC